MNIAMKLTFEGLIRALRWQAHAIAEDGMARDRDERSRQTKRETGESDERGDG